MYGYKVFKFKSKGKAVRKQKEIKRKFGYSPSIFKVSKEGRFKHFSVIRPFNLKKIK